MRRTQGRRKSRVETIARTEPFEPVMWAIASALCYAQLSFHLLGSARRQAGEVRPVSGSSEQSGVTVGR